MPEYFSEDFLADIELLSVYNFLTKWFLKELVLPFLQDNWRMAITQVSDVNYFCIIHLVMDIPILQLYYYMLNLVLPQDYLLTL